MLKRPLTQIHQWPQARSRDRITATKSSEKKKEAPVTDLSTREIVPSTSQARPEALSRKQSGLKALRLPLEVRSETRVQNSLGAPRQDIPVWDKYDKVYEVDLIGTVMIAERQPPSWGLVMVRQISTIELDHKVDLLRQLRGQHFLTCFEIFDSGPMADFVFEYMDLSLVQILGAPLFPAEKHIVAIAAQLVEALKFLEIKRMVHGQIGLSNVLVNHVGQVKIAEQELCQKMNNNALASHRDVQDLGSIITHLATKTTTENQDTRIPDTYRYSPALLEFISETTSATASGLSQHPFLERDWVRSDLVSLVSLAQKTSQMFCTPSR